MNKITLPSPAKLNLFLYINGKRSDGYHELQTLFQFLDYGDSLTLERTDSAEIILTNSLESVPDEQNLIYRSAKLLQNQTACKQGVKITLDKKLPMGGGLGGGSSNAATVLIGLNQLWQIGLSLTELAELGLQLGADVPVFIQGVAAFAEGVGEKLTPCQVPEKWYLVLKPPVSIPTIAVFKHPDLARNTPKRSLHTLLNQNWTNDCEKVVRDLYPEVEDLLHWLVQYAPSRLTGTGACVFAEFTSQDDALAVFANKPKNIEGFVAQGVNLSPLHQKLNLILHSQRKDLSENA